MDALDAQNLAEKKKSRICKVINKDYVSSEDELVNEDGRVFAIRPLPWRSTKLISIFEQLDSYHKDKLQNQRGANQTVKRITGENSEKVSPEGAPHWAVKHCLNNSNADSSMEA